MNIGCSILESSGRPVLQAARFSTRSLGVLQCPVEKLKTKSQADKHKRKYRHWNKKKQRRTQKKILSRNWLARPSSRTRPVTIQYNKGLSYLDWQNKVSLQHLSVRSRHAKTNKLNIWMKDAQWNVHVATQLQWTNKQGPSNIKAPRSQAQMHELTHHHCESAVLANTKKTNRWNSGEVTAFGVLVYITIYIYIHNVTIIEDYIHMQEQQGTCYSTR